jgi:cytochrome c-type biogenesis protein CcmH
MAEISAPSRPIAPATIALVLAALIAAGAIAVKLIRSGADDAPAAPAAAAAPDTTAALIAEVRQDPDNDRGWFLLGLSLRGGERFGEAAQAFRRAAELAPRNADYAAYLGEALLLQGGATPPAEAERLFRRALALQPGNPQALYYLATLKDLRGDHRGAVADLIALLRTAPADAPWQPQVREAAITIARDHQIDLAGRLPAAAPGAATAAIPGPSAEQMAAAQAIPPSRQDEMVRSMVDGLAARLRRNPRDADGWIRLMRSRMVLHDEAAARSALASALAAFQGDSATQARLRTAAAELGVPSA